MTSDPAAPRLLPFDPFPALPQRTPGACAAVWSPVQRALAERVRVEPLAELPRFVAGADCAFGTGQSVDTGQRDDAGQTDDAGQPVDVGRAANRGRAAARVADEIFAVALVWDRLERRVVERVAVRRALAVPYVSGYLSFREGPALLEAIGRLTQPFGAICFDGAGLAHPRRCGLACHLGVVLDVPSVGVAKSRLIGTFDEPAPAAGSASPLTDRGAVVGTVLRTRDGVRPLFVSVGHRVDLPSAIALVRACTTRYRLPEPTRQADIEVALAKRG